MAKSAQRGEFNLGLSGLSAPSSRRSGKEDRDREGRGSKAPQLKYTHGGRSAKEPRINTAP
jgi:hypothetical protein